MKRFARGRTAIAIAATAAVAACSGGVQGPRQPGGKAWDHEWAKPVEAAGVPNLHRVSADLYRSAQPDRLGFETIAAMGVRTVVNLREDHSDADLVAGLGMDLVEIPMLPYGFGDEEVAGFLDVAMDPARAPVLVHCLHGADRTGLMCAIYRVAVQGWSREEAEAEMVSGGFGYHAVFQDPVQYIRTFDPGSLTPPDPP